ncbi:LacI family DNA-binding transcriptional regulator [Candidatus Bipolaricaulota bacterium]|nr:LacI family DNA-binding transcriptional regulator [Candidatus Bipolaricaulota bacterium]
MATVSYVINGTRNVAPETAARVRAAMEELSYHPNAVAQSLRTRTTHVIGAVISDISNPFFATLIRGAEDCARENGYSLLICNTSEKLENELVYLQLLSRKRVDGMIIAPTGKNDGLIKDLIARGMQIVFIDRKVEGVAAPAVLSENEEGAYQATRYLIEQGHRKIGIVLGLPHVSTTTERLHGYERALAEAGIAADPSLIVYGHSQVEGARKASVTLLDRADRPSAVFATNNLMTIGLMMAIHELELHCPQDVSVIGFDDFDWAAAFNPPLTTVAQDPYLIGERAVEILFANLNQHNRSTVEVRIPTRFLRRGSVNTIP